MIEEGVRTLPEELEKISINEIQRLVKLDDPIGQYYRTKIEGRTLLNLDLPSWIDPNDWAGELKMKTHMRIPEFKLADPAPLLRAIEEVRTAVEG